MMSLKKSEINQNKRAGLAVICEPRSQHNPLILPNTLVPPSIVPQFIFATHLRYGDTQAPALVLVKCSQPREHWLQRWHCNTNTKRGANIEGVCNPNIRVFLAPRFLARMPAETLVKYTCVIKVRLRSSGTNLRPGPQSCQTPRCTLPSS